PAKITARNSSAPASMIESSWMMPWETVLDTSVERNAPIRFRTAARSTAVLGLRAPVAMGVAIAFAVSWKPLVKSKKSASAITSTTMRAAVSTVRFQVDEAGMCRRDRRDERRVHRGFHFRLPAPTNPRIVFSIGQLDGANVDG